MEFNFDEWAELAKTDPAEFEQRRKKALRVAVEQAPARQRRKLEGTLFRIEANRARAKNPLHHAILASQMMWAAFEQMRESLNQLSRGSDRRGLRPSKSSGARSVLTAATIIKFDLHPRKGRD
jgi:hypothetical protein